MPQHSHNDCAQLYIPRCFIWLAFIFPSLTFAGEVAVNVKAVAVLGSRVPVNLATQAGQPYDAGVIERDVRALWSTRRFEDIRVETMQNEDGPSVFFRVAESPRLRL